MTFHTRSGTQHSAVLRTGAVGATLALLLAGCANGSGDASADSSSSSSSGGLSLKLGTILPETGSLATLGPPEFAGVDLAVKDINDANVGVSVDVTHTDSGDTTTNIATQSATSLLSQGVSGIIGAPSSGVSTTIIDQITGAGVVEISPGATSPDFTDYADDGFFWRTVPSDVLQGQIMGNKLIQDGRQNVAILYMNDAYGIGLSDNIKSTLEGAGVTVAANVTYDPAAANFTSEVG